MSEFKVMYYWSFSTSKSTSRKYVSMYQTNLLGYKNFHDRSPFFTYVIRTSCAADASIFRVRTVVNAVVGAVNQTTLSVSTSEVIQEDGDCSLAKASTAVCNCICKNPATILLHRCTTNQIFVAQKKWNSNGASLE